LPACKAFDTALGSSDKVELLLDGDADRSSGVGFRVAGGAAGSGEDNISEELLNLAEQDRDRFCWGAYFRVISMKVFFTQAT